MKKTCDTCTAENLPIEIPFVAHEKEVCRLERHIKRLWIALIVAVISVVVCNCVWLYCWMQYDYTSEEISVDSKDGGNANFIGQDGNIYNGEDSGEKTEPSEEERQN